MNLTAVLARCPHRATVSARSVIPRFTSTRTGTTRRSSPSRFAGDVHRPLLAAEQFLRDQLRRRLACEQLIPPEFRPRSAESAHRGCRGHREASRDIGNEMPSISASVPVRGASMPAARSACIEASLSFMRCTKSGAGRSGVAFEYALSDVGHESTILHPRPASDSRCSTGDRSAIACAHCGPAIGMAWATISCNRRGDRSHVRIGGNAARSDHRANDSTLRHRRHRHRYTGVWDSQAS